MKRTWTWGLGLAAVGLVAVAWTTAAQPPATPASHRVYELRTYTTNPGKMDDLNKRFREHTNRLFEKHGITIVGFWEPMDEKDGKGNTLVYLLAFPNRDAARAAWKAFGDDPEWKKVYEESHKNGPLVKDKGVKSVFLEPTDYSPLK